MTILQSGDAAGFLSYCGSELVHQYRTLQYLRTKDGREVDFALVDDDKVKQIIEVKNKDDEPTRSLLWFKEKYGFPAVQLIKELKYEKKVKGVLICNLLNYLKELSVFL